LDDRELVRRLLERDPQAETYFFNTYRDKLYRSCVHLLGYQDPEAEDVTQEAFIVALRKLSGFEFRSTLHHWLFRICVNLCYHRIHKRRRQVLHEQEQLEEISQRGSLDRERWREEEERTHRMAELVVKQREVLGDPCRGLLQLRDVEGKSYLDIAETLKVPIGTVMSRLARCKEALKSLVMRALKGEGLHA
jgi:RNA polymerase sigma-70 factor (ECF subfamily)